jgi:hypothetical protein
MHSVRLFAHEDIRIGDFDEPSRGTDLTVRIIAQPPPEADGHVPEKQISRWLNEGGAVLAHD